MVTINDLYFSDISRKLVCARNIYEMMGTGLIQLQGMAEKLSRLDTLATDLREQMATMGMFSLCRSCGEKKGGGCCSAFMANETDAVLLLMNMLMGVAVKPQRDDQFECCYLGPQGCIFKVKPIFCLNYNCHHILKTADRQSLSRLEKCASAVLREQTMVENLLLTRIIV